jgi:hypothetical protein
VLRYQLPIGAFQFTATILGGFLTSKVRNILCIVIILGLIPSLAGMIGIATISLEHKWGLLVCTWLQGVWGVSNILSWSLVASNVAGHTKRTTANGIWFVFYASGNIIGPFLLQAREKPRYITAIQVLCAMFGVCIFCVACLGVLMGMENKRRDKKGGEYAQTEVGDQEGFTDRTDKENKAFRYKL